jgi:hypothetical protein
VKLFAGLIALVLSSGVYAQACPAEAWSEAAGKGEGKGSWSDRL